jgi:KDO2-lipid IV(A) lauroyltransferase
MSTHPFSSLMARLHIATWARETRFLVEYMLIWPIVMLVRYLPEATAFRLGRWIARGAYYLLGNDRRWAYRNLDLVFGDQVSSEKKRQWVIASFQNIVQTRIECIRWTKSWMLEHAFEEGGAATRQLRDECDRTKTGIISITVHLGNYELLPAWCFFHGQPSTVMYRPQDNWRVERLILGSRREYLPNVVARSAVGLMSLSYHLRDGGNVGMLIDINTLDDPVFVDFLGFPAASPPGPAALALATGAAVLPMVAIRQSDGTHRVISIHPPLTAIQTGNRRRDIELNTAQYMNVFERFILAHPEQYNWPHPRWRFRPDGTFWTLQTPREVMEQERVSPRRQPSTPPIVERQALPFDPSLNASSIHRAAAKRVPRGRRASTKLTGRSIKHVIEWGLVLPFFRLFQYLPENSSLRLARTVGRWAFHVCRNERAWALRNLEIIYRDRLPATERRRLAIAVFENIAQTFVEILRMDARWLDQRVDVVGIENARKALAQAQGKGFIGVGGHLGNWEIISGLGRLHGIESIMLARPMDNPWIERELARCRARYRTSTLPRSLSNLAEATRQLREGVALGIAIDLNVIQHPLIVDFMGVPATAARGAAKLAWQENVPVILIIPIRTSKQRYRFILEPVPMQNTGDLERDIQVNTQRMTDQLTAWIHRYPEQWQWLHPRWRRRPDGTDATLRTPLNDWTGHRPTLLSPSLPWNRIEESTEQRKAA